MCGITGILRWEGGFPQRGEIEQMTQALAHRGPDSEGFFERECIAIGHRRLSIIDLEAGKQPMSNADGSIWITYNGEIYNYQELTQTLKQRGYCFSTRSDTEVILHAYQEWGVECLKKFRGMFAFALVDFNNQNVILARDHFGIKPLYYRLGNGYLAFASELAALRAVNDSPPTGSLLAVDFFLRFQYIPTPQTIYQEIFKLPPASFLKVNFDGQLQAPTKYWDVRFEPDYSISDRDWEEIAETTIQQSVAAHLVADVPFGVFLSGGIDSTLVALNMAQSLNRPIEAFTIGFQEADYSELTYAKQVAQQCGLQLHTEIVQEDMLSILPSLVRHYGEPFGDSSAIPTWYVSRLARTRVPMVLSGDGGDEAFGGYDSYLSWMQVGNSWLSIWKLMQSPSRRNFRLILETLQRSIQRQHDRRLSRWLQQILFASDRARHKLWRQEYQALINHPCDVFEVASQTAQNLERLSYAQYLDYQTYLPCDILTKVDIASMSHGLEVRTPLIDVQVVEMAARLPTSQRLRSDGSGAVTGKTLLKRILAKNFSAEFTNRKKQGFALPRSRWFLQGQPQRQWLEEILLKPDSQLHEWFQVEQLKAHLNSHQEHHDNSGLLWLLFVLGMWLEQNPEIQFG
jgi:asparagine synthase (glutamine-hydrolysing)